MNNTAGQYSQLISRLAQTRKRKLWIFFWSRVFWGTAALSALIFVASVSEEIFLFSTEARLAILLLLMLFAAITAAYYLILPALRIAGLYNPLQLQDVARSVGDQFPEVKDRLLDAVQLYQDRERLKSNYSADLIDSSLSDLFRDVSGCDFGKTIDTSPLKRSLKIMAATLAVIALPILLAPGFSLGPIYRIINYSVDFSPAIEVNFYVEPGNIDVVRGADVTVKVTSDLGGADEMQLLSRPEGERSFAPVKMKPSGNSVFTATLKSIVLPTDYQVSAGNNSSAVYRISVSDRPFVRSMKIDLTPPAYTRLPRTTLDENGGNVRAYPGTSVRFGIVANKIISSATILFKDSSAILLSVEGEKASGGFTARKSGAYTVSLKDKNLLSNIDPVEYSLDLIPDEYPSVDILSPGKNIDLTTQMRAGLKIGIKDDFGFSNLKLWYRLVQSRYEAPSEEFAQINIPLPPNDQNQADVYYDWNLEGQSLVPEDVVAYYAEVYDNDNISGPKSARSEIYTIRLPSLGEVFSEINDDQDAALENLKSMAQETKKLKKEIDDLQRQVSGNKGKSSWQQQRKAEEIAKRRDELKQKVEDAVKKMSDILKKAEENNLLSDETMDKYREMRKLMEQLNSPELQDALKKMQESMKRLSPDEMKQAMQNVQLNEEQFKKNLERTIELLKRINIEQKLDELLKRTEELTRRQKELNESTKKEDSESKADQLSRQQEELQKELDSIEKGTESLREKMEEFAKEMPLEEMAAAEEMLKKNKTGGKMRQSTLQMQAGKMQQAGQSQKEAEEELEEFKRQLEKTKKTLLEKQASQIAMEMRRQIENILDLSRKQEGLKNLSGSLDPNSVRFRENKRMQNEVMENLEGVVGALSDVAKKTFAISPEMGKELGSALRQMGEAMQQLEYRNPAGAAQKQGESMSSLNRSAMMMQNSLNSMMEGGKGGMGMAGLMARLEQMAGTQGAINSGTQQAMKMGEGGSQGLSAQQAAEYRRLGSQQSGAQKALEQLAEEAKQGGQYNRLLGDLEQIAREMNEVASDLQQGNVNPETKERQERIFSRLLESTRSMRERDYEKERKAQAGMNSRRESPPEIGANRRIDRLREEILKIREGKYTKDYEELIRNYYNLLGKEVLEDNNPR